MLLAATFGQDLAEVFPDGGIILLLIFDCRFDQIGEGLDELRSRRVLGPLVPIEVPLLLAPGWSPCV